jgi:hypothetical protein
LPRRSGLIGGGTSIEPNYSIEEIEELIFISDLVAELAFASTKKLVLE